MSLTIISLFILKHFIVDFLLQTPYQFLNKGVYGHWGGIVHSGLHGFFTFIVMLMISPTSAIIAAIIDILVHYHIDWAKVNITQSMKWKPDTNPEFWWLLGLDQLFHYLTYLGICAIMIE